ncbi:MAG: winged helix-turn-helix domain-containing protein [Coriobacteriia bacterium]|nr:winged helix-turn-helix domain-containing protein [Coriobacteriia bacterium]
MSGSQPANLTGSLVVDTDAKLVTCAGVPVRLTATEYRILALLARHPGWVFSSDDIVYAVWGYQHHFSSSVSVHIAHIRQKLRAACADAYIDTVRGLGYRLMFTPSRQTNEASGAPLVQEPRSVPLERDRFFRRITSQLNGDEPPDTVLSLITGVEGIGKTWSLYEAERIAIRHEWFPLWFDCRLSDQRQEGLLSFIVSTLHAEGLAEVSRGRQRGTTSIAAPDSAAACHTYRELIGSAVAQRPMLLIFDDADYMDDRSASILGYVASECRREPLGIVVAAQDNEWRLKRLLSEHSAGHFELKPLSNGVLHELAREQGIEWLTDEQLEMVTRVTSGVPGRLVELSGALRHLSQGEVISEARLITLALTPRMRSGLAAQLDAMSPARVEFLKWLAVSGNHLDTRDLDRITGLGPEELWQQLQNAMDSGVITGSSEKERVCISDPLLARFLHDRMPPEERARRRRVLERITS